MHFSDFFKAPIGKPEDGFHVKVRDNLPVYFEFSSHGIFSPWDTVPIAKKEPFYLGDKIYTIDSIDLVHQKILINYHKDLKAIQFVNKTTVSLFSVDTISTVVQNKNLRLIHNWGTWCGPCMAKMPDLIQAQKDYPNITFIGMAMDYDKNTAITKAEEIGLNWSNLYYNGWEEWMDKNGDNFTNTFPTYMLVDSENNIIAKENDVQLALDKLTE